MSRLRFVIIPAVLSFEILGDVLNLKQSQESGMFAPIGHPDHKNVVELVHPVDLGQQLVDDGVVHLRNKLDNLFDNYIVHPRALATARPSSLTDRIDLVEDNDVQTCNDQKMMV